MYDMKPYLERIEAVIEKGPYQDTWESLSKYRVPEWYQKLKFGIFIHWGVFSVPAFSSEWYPRNMYIQGSEEYRHHLETYGPHSKFGYKDFVPLFKGEKFDPEVWADLFKKAGAQYVMPVAEHHDGFQMYASEISHWNAAEMGPKRNVLGELKEAVQKREMVFCASTHRIEHWFFLGHGRDFDSDIKDPLERGDLYWPSIPDDLDGPGEPLHNIHSKPYPTEEYLQDWMVRTCELIDKYRPRVLYFDWWIQHESARPYLKKIAAYHYNRAAERGEEAVINYKHDAFLFGTAVPDVERGQFADVKPYIWQTDTAMALNSWSFTPDNVYRTAEEILCDLVDIVSKNGRLLLNIGPKADGTFSDQETEILTKIGKWLSVNGEAIYDADIWRISGEGPTRIVEGQFSDGIKKEFTSEDFRFTTAGGYLYATALRCSETGEYCIRSLGIRESKYVANFNGIIKDVRVLGDDDSEALRWERREEGLHIKTAFRSTMPVVFKIQVE